LFLVAATMALCGACLVPLGAARLFKSSIGPHGFVAEVCAGLKRGQHMQVSVGWISAQASGSIARPSPYYLRPRLTICAFVPWTPLLREQGGFVFPG
jgi:hypothetical protein